MDYIVIAVPMECMAALRCRGTLSTHSVLIQTMQGRSQQHCSIFTGRKMKLPGRLPSVSRFTPEIHLGLLYQRYCDDRWVFDIIFLRVEGTQLCSLSFVFVHAQALPVLSWDRKGCRLSSSSHPSVGFQTSLSVLKFILSLGL